MNPGNELCFHV